MGIGKDIERIAVEVVRQSGGLRRASGEVISAVEGTVRIGSQIYKVAQTNRSPLQTGATMDFAIDKDGVYPLVSGSGGGGGGIQILDEMPQNPNPGDIWAIRDK